MRRLFFISLILLGLSTFSTFAQDDSATFRNFQFSFNRVSNAWLQYNDTLKKMFESKGLKYPCNNVFIRFFKSNNTVELWAKENDSAKYQLVKNYRFCALSGSLGPKRNEGDRQVPEGLYFIDDYNPKSDYFLSLLLSYPNYSDLYFGNKERPGGDIYIHGGCVTVGCLPMTDPIIQEIYVLCLASKFAGENHIPVHVYPIRFDKKGLDFLGKNYSDDKERQKFWVNLKSTYDYFEQYRKLPVVMYNNNGEYVH